MFIFSYLTNFTEFQFSEKLPINAKPFNYLFLKIKKNKFFKKQTLFQSLIAQNKKERPFE